MEVSTTRLWAWDGGWGLMPAVAVLGSIWTFGVESPASESSQLLLAMGLALAWGGWGTMWRALVTTDWATSLHGWRTWDHEAMLPHFPYLQPGTPGAALHRVLRQGRAWWQSQGQYTLALPLQATFLTALLSILVSMVLGRTALLLTFLFLAWTQFAVLWNGGNGRVGPLWEAVALMGLPWLLGVSLAGTLQLEFPLSVLSVLTLILLGGSYAHPSWWALIGPLVAAGFFVWREQSLAAGAMLLLALPGWRMIPHLGISISLEQGSDIYRRVVAPWLLVMVLIIAMVL
ncbi:MAG: hypothetical protein JXA33_14745 [Anaerolineae bacterium]|nr:hypothetical protein [Anaerolineae bacterium]